MRKRQAPRPRAQAPDAPGADGSCTGAHTRHRLRYHPVWVPKCRKRVLGGPVAARLLALLRQACEVNRWGLHEVNRWGLHEVNVQPDHVHLLLQASPAECVSDVVGSLKGGTSRVLRSEFPDLAEYLWGDSFWADSFWADSFWGDSFWADSFWADSFWAGGYFAGGYFAETVGQTGEAVLRAYIQNQGQNPPRRPLRTKRTRP